jgi:dihydrofolate reductase
MRKIVCNTFATLDGVMQGPGGPEEDRANNFNYGGWSVSYWDEVMETVMKEFMRPSFDLLLGRKTYEIFAAHWQFVKDDPTGDKFNKATKYVASNTLTSPMWQNTVFLNKDIVQQIQELKNQDGIEIQIHGSSNLIQTLQRHNLIDEYHVWTFPIVLGQGKRLFENGSLASGLQLTAHQVSKTGVVMATYIPKGEIKLGSFAMEEPTALEIERRKHIR